MLRVIEYFAKSPKVSEGHSKWHLKKGVFKSLLVFRCNYVVKQCVSKFISNFNIYILMFVIYFLF